MSYRIGALLCFSFLFLLSASSGYSQGNDDMQLIPSGEFLMGDHRDRYSDAWPVHSVTLDAFYMSKYEITNRQYCEFLNSSISSGDIRVVEGIVYGRGDILGNFPYCDMHSRQEHSHIDFSAGVFKMVAKDGTVDMSNHPVVHVSWYGAAAYCNWKSKQDGYESCYDISTWQCDLSKYGYRLPLESEWEYAARGGKHSPYLRFPLGDGINGTMSNFWTSGDPFEKGSYPWTTPVGYYDGSQVPTGSDTANGYGLYDMAGNVQELCNDWYRFGYSTTTSPANNPKGPVKGTFRNVRGGFWKGLGYRNHYNRNSFRCRQKPERRNAYAGFRIVRIAGGFSTVIESGAVDKKEPTNEMKLWYGKPADDWRDGLPIGNGQIGAMVLGSVPRERIALNHNRLWRQIRHKGYEPPKVSHLLEGVQKLYFEGRYSEGERAVFFSPWSPPDQFTTFGDLYINFPGHDMKNITDYRSELDLETGIAKVSYVHNGTTYVRQTFASRVDDVIVVRLSADKDNAITSEIELSRVADKDFTFTGWAKKNRFGFFGRYIEGVRFAGIAKVIKDGGKLIIPDEKAAKISVENSDEVLIILSLTTGKNAGDDKYRSEIDSYVRSILKKIKWNKKLADDFEDSNIETPVAWTPVLDMKNLSEGDSVHGNGGVMKISGTSLAMAPVDVGPCRLTAKVAMKQPAVNGSHHFNVFLRADPSNVIGGVRIEYDSDTLGLGLYDSSFKALAKGGFLSKGFNPDAAYTIQVTDLLETVNVVIEEVGDPENRVEATAFDVGGIIGGTKLMLGRYWVDAGETGVLEFLDAKIELPRGDLPKMDLSQTIKALAKSDPCIEFCNRHLDKFNSNTTFSKLAKRHIAEHSEMFNRVDISFGGDPKAYLPTDQRLELYAGGEDDPGLIPLYFQFGRYVILSSSRPGSLPANLQGIWNGDLHPIWDSAYTSDCNIQMNYWAAEVTNLSECHEAYFGLYEDSLPAARKTARNLYGCRGIYFSMHFDPQKPAKGNDWEWTGSAAWMAQHFWLRWEYTQDKDFLRDRAYPVYKELGMFYEDFLVPDPRPESEHYGKLVTVPSYSPEAFLIHNGGHYTTTIGATMDFHLIHYVFTNLIEASKILGVDADKRQSWQDILDNIPPMQVGKYGQLQEWLEDHEEKDLYHRHISHLWGLFPGDRITLEETPEFAQAAFVSLERKMSPRSAMCPWPAVWSWYSACLARLQQPELAYDIFTRSLSDNGVRYRNFFSKCREGCLGRPVFQIDGNGAAPAAVVEMLMQSHNGEIKLLPALPKAWPNGHINGLIARGAFEVDIEWTDGELVRAVIKSRIGNDCNLRYSNKTIKFKTQKGKKYSFNNSLERIDDD